MKPSPAPSLRSSPSRSVKSVRPGPGPRKRRPPVRESRSSRDAAEPFGKQPTFSKTEDPSFTRFPDPGFRAGPASVALHGARLAFDRQGLARCAGLFDQHSAKTDSLLTPRADRFRPNRMNGAGLSRSRAPSAAERLRRIESRAPTSATNVKIEHTHERHESPHAGVERLRRPSKAAGGGAPVTRLGVELPLHRSPRLDQASAVKRERPARVEAGTLVGQRGG